MSDSLRTTSKFDISRTAYQELVEDCYAAVETAISSGMVLSDRLKALQDQAPAGSENVVRSMVIQRWVWEQLFFNAKVLQDGDKPAIADMLGDQVHEAAKDRFIAKHMPELLVQSPVLPPVPSLPSSVEPIKKSEQELPSPIVAPDDPPSSFSGGDSDSSSTSDDDAFDETLDVASEDSRDTASRHEDLVSSDMVFSESTVIVEQLLQELSEVVRQAVVDDQTPNARTEALQGEMFAAQDAVAQSEILYRWMECQLRDDKAVLSAGNVDVIAQLLGEKIHSAAKRHLEANYFRRSTVSNATDVEEDANRSLHSGRSVSDATDSDASDDGYPDDEPAESEGEENDGHQSDDKKDEGKEDRDGNDKRDERRDDGEASEACLGFARAVTSQIGGEIFSGAAVSKVTRQAVRQSVKSSTASSISTLVPGASGKAIYGAAAKQHVAKVCGECAGAAAVSFAVSSVMDIRAHIKGDIDDERLCKRMVNNAIGASASGVGSTVGAAWGTVLIPIPLVGTAVGGILGGMLGNLIAKPIQFEA